MDGIGVLIYNNCYTSITDNVHALTRVRSVFRNKDIYNADGGTSRDTKNEKKEEKKKKKKKEKIKKGRKKKKKKKGELNLQEEELSTIWHIPMRQHLRYFKQNNFTHTHAAGRTTYNVDGIAISSVYYSICCRCNFGNNNVTDARSGYNLWNCPTLQYSYNQRRFSNGLPNWSFANNFDGYASDASTSLYAMTGVTTSNCDTVIWVRDNMLNSNPATVALQINNATNSVNGTESVF
ncbi:MAG: hypothetical protein IPG95_05465 [Saprospiraceae bacterium]|nr:hypothetical protein [Saprospiraceae bacterium]